MERLFLDSARVLLLVGTVLVISTAGNPGADTARAFIGFLILLLGVFLIMLSPVASQLPGAARVGVVMENTSLNQYYFARNVAGPAVLQHMERLFLDYARVLLLVGTVLVISTAGNPDADTARAFIGFLISLLGVFLIMLSPVASQLPGAARVGVVMENTSLNQYYFARNVAGPAVLQHMERLFLDSARVLLLVGTVLVISTAGNPDADTARAFIGFLISLLGVFLIMLSPVASQFPGAARVGAVMENTFLNQYYFAADVAGPAVLQHMERLFLGSARVLLLVGTVLVISTIGNPGPDTVRAFIGLLLLLLGVFLGMLWPAASQLPCAARVGAATENADQN